MESAGRKFADDDAGRKANEAQRRGDNPIRVERSADGRTRRAVAERVSRLAELLFGHGPLPVAGMLIALILFMLGIVALGNRGSPRRTPPIPRH